MLELRSPAGAFELIEAYLREHGFFAPGGEDLEADLYLGYGLSEPLRRHEDTGPTRAVPPAPRSRVVRHDGPGRAMPLRHAVLPRRCPDRAVGADVERCGVRRGGRGRARRDRARGRLPGEPRAAPLGAVLRRSRGLAALLAGFAPRTHAGDGWAIVSASPELFLARRGRRVWTCPIKGTRPLGEHVEGEKDSAEHVMIVDLERNDLSRVCEPGSVRWPELMAERELAGVTHLVSTVEGTLRRGVGLAELLGGDLPRRLRDGRAQDRRARPDRRPRARRPRCLDGGARDGARKRRPRARAHDPHLRGRRGADPPVGRRRASSGTPSPTPRSRSRGRRHGRCSRRSAHPIEAGAR